MRTRISVLLALALAAPLTAQRVSQDRGDLSALPAHVIVDSCSGCGGSSSGPIAIDQTTPGTTNGVVVNNVPHIVCDSGCGSPPATADGSAFTFGTTSVSPIGAVVDDVSTNTVSENSFGAPRMSGSRVLYVDLGKTTANGTAIKVDGSAVTQPVSGTFFQATQPVSGTFFQATQPVSGPLTDTQLRASAVPVSGTFFQATQPVSGTVTANAGTNLNTSALALDATVTGRLPTGASPATGESNTNTNLSRIGGYNFIFNGTTWDRWTGAISGTVTTTPPANASTNVAQVAGTATSVNSGVKDAGTLRVVLATDQPALTNKLLVTPDSVALPANQSVNVAQVNGVTTTTGAGATGTGVQRVNNVSAAATGAAPPAAATYVGGLISGATGGFLGGITVCDLSKPINISTATTTLMVTGVSGRQVRICSFHVVTAAANNVAWLEGTGATCATGTAGMAGGTTAASGYNFAANSGIAIGSGIGEVLTTATAGDSVCLITSAATQLSGFIKYTIF